MKKLILPLALLSLAPFVRADEPKPAADAPVKAEGLTWFTDFEAAKTEAAKSGRDLLVDFTGSDWCVWCKKLKAEVFDQAGFASAAKQYVFVELDYPRAKTLPDDIKKQNTALASKFAIKGYPTILLLDSKGVPYASTGYKEGGPDAYLKNLADLRAGRTDRAAKIAAADALTGDAKAKALADIARGLDSSIRNFQTDLMAKLAAADPQDKQGVKLEESIEALDGKARDAFGAKQDIDAALKVFDDFLAEHPAIPVETKQKLLFGRFGLVAYRIQKTVSDKAEISKQMLAEVDRVIALAPDSETAAQMKSFRPRIEAMGKPKAPVAK